MKLNFTVTLLLLTGMTILADARPGRGLGQTGEAGHTVEDLSAALISGITTRVSVASDGTEGNGGSFGPSISADGRFVVFSSGANNLVSGDNNDVCYDSYGANYNCIDVFVHDRTTGETIRVSVASGGTEGNGHSRGGSVSANGRFVAFVSEASNLASADNNGTYDVFVHDRDTDETTRVSLASDGAEGNGGSAGASLSADGRSVAFVSGASNLVSGDNNGYDDVFVHDRDTGETTRVSLASDGTEGNADSGGASISADGQFVVFVSDASNLVSGDSNGYDDVFVHNRDTGETIRVSVASDGTEGNLDSGGASISADGRFVAFSSDADNLISGDSNKCYLAALPCRDIFVHDRDSGETIRVSVASDGTEGNLDSGGASISPDGRVVAFVSGASNLVSGDNNGTDVFVHDRDIIPTFFPLIGR